MFRCGIYYPRCRWILPLLLFFAVIFQLIAVAAKSGWVEDKDAETHYASMWDNCRGRDDVWDCQSLMNFSWAKAVAALMIIALIILIITFIVSIVAMVNVSVNTFYGVAALLLIVVILQFIALIIYPVNFNGLIFEGEYFYTWAYGFGWGATIICLGSAILFLVMTRYEEDLRGETKPHILFETA